MSIEKDYLWVKRCVESSLTGLHLQVGEKLVRAFQRKWKENPEINFYLPNLMEAQREMKNNLEDAS